MLLTNYRSTGHILRVANSVISKNPDRFDKALISASHDGAQVRVCAVEDEDAEAQLVANRIFTLLEDSVPASQIAVLFRSNVQSRSIELALRTHKIPYRLVGGLDLFDHKEIKDALSYLRVLHNPEEEQALRRIVNWPPRGIGDTSFRRVEAWATKKQIGLLEAMEQADQVEGLQPRGVDAVLGLAHVLSAHRKSLARRKASTVVKRLFHELAFEDALLRGTDDPAAAERKLENVRALVRQLERFEERSKQQLEEAQLAQGRGEAPTDADEDLADELEVGSLEGFLAELALSGFGDSTTKDERTEKVVLSTVHAAKGLEWPHVFSVGWEEELLPHRRTLREHSELCEERRIAYVAITRAKRNLSLSWAKHRVRYGQVVARQPSRFLEGLPDDSVERLEDALRPPKTEAEEIAIGESWAAKIRAQLGGVD